MKRGTIFISTLIPESERPGIKMEIENMRKADKILVNFYFLVHKNKDEIKIKGYYPNDLEKLCKTIYRDIPKGMIYILKNEGVSFDQEIVELIQ